MESLVHLGLYRCAVTVRTGLVPCSVFHAVPAGGGGAHPPVPVSRQYAYPASIGNINTVTTVMMEQLTRNARSARAEAVTCRPFGILRHLPRADAVSAFWPALGAV